MLPEREEQGLACLLTACADPASMASRENIRLREKGCPCVLLTHTAQGSTRHRGVLHFRSGSLGRRLRHVYAAIPFCFANKKLPRGEKANSVLLESAVRGLEINVGEGGAEERVGVGRE